MIAQIPLQAIPNQRITTIVNQQRITLDIVTKGDRGIYADIYLGANLMMAGARCNNLTSFLQYPTDVIGYLYFETVDYCDPSYVDFGTKCFLYYADFDVITQKYNTWKAING
jgi:hypothetical protein